MEPFPDESILRSSPRPRGKRRSPIDLLLAIAAFTSLMLVVAILCLPARHAELGWIEVLVFLGNASLLCGVAIYVANQRKQSSRELARYQSIVQSSSDAIISTDLQGLVETWNDAATRIYGFTAEEMMGRSLVDALSEDRRQAARDGIERASRGECAPIFEYTRPNVDGQMVRLTGAVSPVRDDNQKVIGTSAIIRDVTELRRMEEDMRAKQELERANQAKSEFLSRMSHELRTPLNAILGFAQLLELKSENERFSDSAEQITKAGRHLLSMINGILDISRIESGRVTVDRSEFDLRLAILEATDITAPLANARGISVELDLHAEAMVNADRQKSVQILINLLSNGIKFNRENGRILVAMSRLGDEYQVTVHDTGTGIDLNQLDRLFVPFDRLGAEQTKIEGTGLGLTLSRKYADAMGGSLTLAGTGQTGSVFCFSLPVGPLAETGVSQQSR